MALLGGCARFGCGHALRGGGRDGHFGGGQGPCKTLGCRCPGYVSQARPSRRNVLARLEVQATS
jgi:hypothetical protein